MKIQLMGKWDDEKTLVIKATCSEDGELIRKWHNQILNHMKELDITKSKRKMNK